MFRWCAATRPPLRTSGTEGQGGLSRLILFARNWSARAAAQGGVAPMLGRGAMSAAMHRRAFPEEAIFQP
jgi:hypothetical protein